MQFGDDVVAAPKQETIVLEQTVYKNPETPPVKLLITEPSGVTREIVETPPAVRAAVAVVTPSVPTVVAKAVNPVLSWAVGAVALYLALR